MPEAFGTARYRSKAFADVMRYLNNRATGDDLCRWDNVETIAEFTGYTIRAVELALAKAQTDGWILATRERFGKRRLAVTVYWLRWRLPCSPQTEAAERRIDAYSPAPRIAPTDPTPEFEFMGANVCASNDCDSDLPGARLCAESAQTFAPPLLLEFSSTGGENVTLPARDLDPTGPETPEPPVSPIETAVPQDTFDQRKAKLRAKLAGLDQDTRDEIEAEARATEVYATWIKFGGIESAMLGVIETRWQKEFPKLVETPRAAVAKPQPRPEPTALEKLRAMFDPGGVYSIEVLPFAIAELFEDTHSPTLHRNAVARVVAGGLDARHVVTSYRVAFRAVKKECPLPSGYASPRAYLGITLAKRQAIENRPLGRTANESQRTAGIVSVPPTRPTNNP